MSSILSMDPGMSTGIVWADLDDDIIPRINAKWQEEQGLSGVLDWAMLNSQVAGFADRLVCEKWHPRPTSRVYKLDELEPVRIEGYLQSGWDDILLFRQPEQRHLFKEGPDFAKSAAFLKWAGYWTTGAEVGCKDANDTNSAMMHLFGYLRDNKHRPTIRLLLDYNRSIAKEEGTT